jgi:hypothetical protein
LFGILLFAGGIALLAAYFVVPDFLYGASLFGGLAGLLAPFGLVVLGLLLMYVGFLDLRKKKKR